jgi:hypothetical protein
VQDSHGGWNKGQVGQNRVELPLPLRWYGILEGRGVKRNNALYQRPIHCTLCPRNDNGDPPTFWKYNAFHHMAECHMVNGEIPVYPDDLQKAIHISLYEERLLGIDEEDTRSC